MLDSGTVVENLCDYHRSYIKTCARCGHLHVGKTSLCYTCNQSYTICENCNSIHDKGADCDHCKQYLGVCPICHRKTYVNYTVDGELVCKACHKSARSCTRCRKPTMAWLHSRSGSCFQCRKKHSEPVLEAHNYVPPYFTTDAPSDVYFGVENELAFVNTDHSSIRLSELSGLFDKRVMYTQHDGTVTNGIECVFHPRTLGWFYENKAAISETFKWAIDDGTAGMHVHINRSAFKDRQDLLKFMTFIAVNRDFITFIAERGPKEGGRSWVNTPPDILRLKAKGRDLQDKYVDVNIRHSATIEVRIFRGALTWERFIKNIEFLDALLKYVKTHKLRDMRSPSKFISTVTHPNLLAYIGDNKFKDADRFKMMRKVLRLNDVVRVISRNPKYGQTGYREIDDGEILGTIVKFKTDDVVTVRFPHTSATYLTTELERVK